MVMVGIIIGTGCVSFIAGFVLAVVLEVCENRRKAKRKAYFKYNVSPGHVETEPQPKIERYGK